MSTYASTKPAKVADAIGAKRLVVGAHYGVAAFIGQRATAVILALFTVGLVLRLLFVSELNYDSWAGIFVPLPMKIVTLLAFFALFYHAWVGVRDIWMDYIKPTWLRLSLQVGTVLWLIFCAVWTVQILWRV
jgi:succinate dehydrogenase / fumarate reductase membrane anchor subunit